MVCHVCFSTKELKWCGNCRGVKYCSKGCQVKDWPTHKLDCQGDRSDRNKQFSTTVRKLFKDEKLFEFISSLAYHATLLRLKYLLIEVAIGGATITCSGTNDLPPPIKEKDIIPNKLNCLIIQHLPNNEVAGCVMAFDSAATRRRHSSLMVAFNTITNKHFRCEIDTNYLFVTVYQADDAHVIAL